MQATQRPLSEDAFGSLSGEPAWTTVPSWYLVATRDNAIPMATQRNQPPPPSSSWPPPNRSTGPTPQWLRTGGSAIRSRSGNMCRVLIDHLVYGAPELLAAVDDLEERFGVRAQRGGKHVGLGTHNALLALGPRTYLEIIAPDPDQPTPPTRRPFGLDDLTEPRLVGWAASCDDIDTAISNWRAHGYEPGEVIDMQRDSPSGTVLRWRLTLNALEGGPVPFLIAWDDTEHPARSAPKGLTLEAFDIEHPDPANLTPVLAALAADVTVKPASSAQLVAHIRGPHGLKELR